MSQRMQGTVKWFDMSKGYGYIENGTEEDIFVYYQDIADKGFKYPAAGDRVEFAVTQKPRGPVATEVTRV